MYFNYLLVFFLEFRFYKYQYYSYDIPVQMPCPFRTIYT